MNRHPGLFSLALLGSILFLSTIAADVSGQSGGGAPSLDALKGSTSVAAAGPQIAAAIDAQVKNLMSADPAAAARAREELIDAANPGRVNPTAAFLNAYAGALNTGIATALKHESDLVRLNAAIIVARVAERTDNSAAALQGATITLLNDPSPFVVLWGLKAARAVIPAMLRNPAINPGAMFTALVKAAGAHASGVMGSPIAIEAYEALTLDIFDPGRKPTDAELLKVIPIMQQLLQQRVQMYIKTLPPEPLAENRATLFLVNSRVWAQHDAKQKLASVQIMSNLANLGAQHYAAAAPELRVELAPMIANVAAAIAVVPESAPIQAQLGPAVKINAGTDPQEVMQAVSAIVPALKTVKAFAAIQPPPSIAPTGEGVAGGGGTTQPATSPTTAGAAPAAAASSP